MSDAYDRARADAQQDSFENSPFACVGGLDKRTAMTAPKWIAAEDVENYLRGYRDQALQMYGADWQTCSFGWAPAITIEGTVPAPAIKSAAEWAIDWDNETDSTPVEVFVARIQLNVLESAKTAIVAALQCDYCLERAEHVVVETINQLKREGT